MVNTDNSASAAVLRSGRAKDRILASCSRQLWNIAATHDITPVPGAAVFPYRAALAVGAAVVGIITILVVVRRKLKGFIEDCAGSLRGVYSPANTVTQEHGDDEGVRVNRLVPPAGHDPGDSAELSEAEHVFGRRVGSAVTGAEGARGTESAPSATGRRPISASREDGRGQAIRDILCVLFRDIWCVSLEIAWVYSLLRGHCTIGHHSSVRECARTLLIAYDYPLYFCVCIDLRGRCTIGHHSSVYECARTLIAYDYPLYLCVYRPTRSLHNWTSFISVRRCTNLIDCI